MTKNIALSCRSLDMTKDLTDILKKLESGSKETLSSKFRIVQKQGRLWAWLKHFFGLETTHADDVAKAFVRFTKNNQPLFMEKKIEENHKKATLILGHILGLKIEGDKILINESSSKIVRQFEKYVGQSSYLKSFPKGNRPTPKPKPIPDPETFPEPQPEPPSERDNQIKSVPKGNRPTPQPKPIPNPELPPEQPSEKDSQTKPVINLFVDEILKAPIDLESSFKFFTSLDSCLGKKEKEICTHMKNHPELVDVFLKIVKEGRFDDSKKAKKCLKDMCFLGGLFQDETKTKELYNSIKGLDLPNNLNELLTNMQLLSLTIQNKHSTFDTLLPKCINPDREKLWGRIVNNGLVEVAKALLNRGGQETWEFTYIDKSDHSVQDCSTSCLHQLARYGVHENTVEIAELALAVHPELLNTQVKGTGNTPLIEAVEKSNLKMVAWLISKNPEMTLKDDEGKSAEMIATEKGDPNILELIQKAAGSTKDSQTKPVINLILDEILKAPIDLESSYKFFRSLDSCAGKTDNEVYACMNAHPEFQDLFLRIVKECPFDDSKKAKKCLGDMSLLGATFQDEAKTEALYNEIQGLNLSVRFKKSLATKQLLSLALHNKHSTFGTLLSKSGIPNRAKLWDLVVHKGLVEAAKALLNYGRLEAWRCIYEKEGESPAAGSTSCLHQLARYGTHENTVEIAELALAAYPKLLNTQAKGTGNTPLIEAVEKSNLKMVAWLLTKNPEMTLKDDEGKSAEMIANEKNDPNILELIQKAKVLV